MRPDVMILIEQKVNNGFELIGIEKDFLNVTTQAVRPKINKWNFMKLNSLFTVKNTIIRTKPQATECKIVFAKYISEKHQYINYKININKNYHIKT